MNMRGKGTEMAKKHSRVATTIAKNKSHRKIKFKLKAAEGCNVYLVGSFNNWDPQAVALKHNGDGLYSTSIVLPPGRHEYKFLVNDIWWIDEECPHCVPNAFGSFNNVIEVS